MFVILYNTYLIQTIFKQKSIEEIVTTDTKLFLKNQKILEKRNKKKHFWSYQEAEN